MTTPRGAQREISLATQLLDFRRRIGLDDENAAKLFASSEPLQQGGAHFARADNGD